MPFYVCPGTWTWNTIAGRTENAWATCATRPKTASSTARSAISTPTGATRPLAAAAGELPGLCVGRGASWAWDANRDDVAQAISLYAFDDPTGTMGRVAYDLGNVYQKTEVVPTRRSWRGCYSYRELAADRAVAGLNAAAGGDRSRIDRLRRAMARSRPQSAD